MLKKKSYHFRCRSNWFNYSMEITRGGLGCYYHRKKGSSGDYVDPEMRDFILDTGPHIFHTPEKLLKNFWKKNTSVIF